MSDWNRYGREDDQRRRGFDERERRSAGQEDSYGQYGDWRDRESRSFEDRERGGGRDWRGPGGPQRYGQPAYGERGQPRYGQEGGGVFGGNERLERISDGESEVGHFFGHQGEHRGRGPKNYTRSDERIREDVNDRLSDDAWLDASEIEVQVASGEVTLSGEVGSRDDKRRAEDIADRVSGVKHVQNNLRVQERQAGARPTTGQGLTGESQMTGRGGTISTPQTRSP